MRESCPEMPAGALMTVRSVSEIIKIDKFLYDKTKFGHSKAAFEVIARSVLQFFADKLLLLFAVGSNFFPVIFAASAAGIGPPAGAASHVINKNALTFITTKGQTASRPQSEPHKDNGSEK